MMSMFPALLLQEDLAVEGGILALGGAFFLLIFAIALVMLIGLWKVFTKAGQPGWAVIVPIYNTIILLKIAGRPAWWFLLLCIPLVNIVILLLVSIDIAKSFGQSAAFGVVLLFLLSGIGYLVLGFGGARYVGPAAATA